MLNNSLFNNKTKIVGITCALFYSFYLLTAIISSRSLYADGSFFFFNIVSNSINKFWPYFDDSKHIRLFSNIINQFPLSISLKLGFLNKAILRNLFSIPLFLTNAIGLSICFWLTWRAKARYFVLFPLASYILFMILSEIFIVNQAFLAFWLYYILYFYAVLDLKIQKIDYFILPIIIILIFRSHEGIIIYGPIMILSILLVLKKSPPKLRNPRLTILLCVILQVCFATWWQYTHPVSSETKNYIDLLFLLIQPGVVLKSNLIFTLFGTLLILSVYFVKTQNLANRLTKIIYLLIFIILFIICLYLIISGVGINPNLEYKYRIFLTFGGAGIMILNSCAILIKDFREQTANRFRFILNILMGVLIIQSIWQIGNNYYWGKFVSEVRNGLQNHSYAILDPGDKELIDNSKIESRYQWDWAYPTLSMAITDSYHIDRIFAPIGYSDYFKVDKERKELSIPFMTVPTDLFKIDSLFRNVINKYEYAINDTIYFNNSITNENYLIEGWADHESWGTWSKSSTATIKLKLLNYNKGVDLKLNINFIPYVGSKTQKISFSVNGEKIDSWSFLKSGENVEKSSLIPAKLVNDDNTIFLRFDISNPTSPSSIGESNDLRELGIGIKSIIVK